MLSRVAESIYWMCRYVERAENVARFIDVNLHLMLDLPSETEQQWEALVDTTGDVAIFEEHFGEYTRENVMQFLTFDPDYPNSILRCVHRARENARSVREAISSEMWIQINRFHLMMRNAAFSDFDVALSPHEFYTQIKLTSHTFEGIMNATMSHGEAFQFGRLGRYLERADKTSRILDMKYFILLPDVTYVGTPLDNIQWAAVLQSASALEMYRKRYGRISPDNVVDFLLLDQEFPRAARYCVRGAEASLRAITGSPPGTYRNRAEQGMGRLAAELDFTSTEEIMTLGLHEFVDGRLQVGLNAVGGGIQRAFFSPSLEQAATSQTQLQTQAG